MEKIQIQVKVSLSSVLNTFAALAVITSSVLLLQSCKTKTASNGDSAIVSDGATYTPKENFTKASDEISVMVMNVENLFDTAHDKDREDFTYLPLDEKGSKEVIAHCENQRGYYKDECFNLDWVEENLQFKRSQIAKTILHTDGGKGADILLLVEVENLNVLNQLADKELKEAGYVTRVLVEGPDTRGIDNGLLSKFPLKGEPINHVIPYVEPDPEQLKWAKRSRGILEATLQLPNNKEVTVLVGHFPSQRNPTAWRKQSIEFLKNKISELQKKGKVVITGGDFNITREEDNSTGYISKTLSEVVQVSHLVGCKSCAGSHNYRGSWSFLDILAFDKNLDKANLSLITDSITTVRAPHHTKKNGTPLRFSLENEEGVSDHFPMYAKLKLLPEAKVEKAASATKAKAKKK